MSDITLMRQWVESDQPEPEDGWDWPSPPIHAESSVTGELRTQILVKLGRADRDQAVRLIESEIEGGWSEWTAEIDYEIEVWIHEPGKDPERVWNRDTDWNAKDAMSAFLKWAVTTERNPDGVRR
jgi:hypothetical protein